MNDDAGESCGEMRLLRQGTDRRDSRVFGTILVCLFFVNSSKLNRMDSIYLDTNTAVKSQVQVAYHVDEVSRKTIDLFSCHDLLSIF